MSFSVTVHLPALQVVIPLLCAPVCVLVRRPRLAWAVAVLGSWAALAVAARLLHEVLDGATISYALGGWAAPWGIEYRVDRLSAFVLLVVAAIAAVLFPCTRASVERDVGANRTALLYTAAMLNLAGLLGVVITGDVFNLFVFLEIASLSSYVLVALGRDRGALLAAFRYLVMGTVGATFILIGIALLYALTGTLNFADLGERLPRLAENSAVKVAFVFLILGVALKMALFPLHAWLPNAYARAPSMVSALLAATSTKVAVYVLVRLVFTVFGARFAFASMHLDWWLLPLALAGILIASTVALYQNDVKRMLAYSSVAQVAYLALGISFVSATGLTAVLVHVFNHALMKSALFVALGCVVFRTGGGSLDALSGLGRRMPLTMAGFVIAGLSLVGVPLTVGFVSKWYLLRAAIEAGSWAAACVIVVASVLALLYVGRVAEVAYLRAPRPGSVQERAHDGPLGSLVALWLLVAASVFFGLHTDLSVGVAQRIAAALLGGSG